MAEYYSFFDSTEGDIREYTSSQFAEYFSRFLTDGIYTENNLMGLKATISGFNLKVSSGFAYVRGYMYKNDSDIDIVIDGSDAVLDRIDRVVLKLDIVNRKMNIQLKKGNMGSQPNPPALIDDASVKELSIAQIRVNKNTTTGIVTDERVPVSSLIDIPFEDMAAEFKTWFESKQQSVGIEIYSGKTEPPNIATGDLWFREVE